MAGPSLEAAKNELYRSVIAEAAEQVFAAQGYAEAKVAEIALKAGVSLGTLYKVFDGKAELLAAVHQRRAEEIYAIVLAALGTFPSPLRLVVHGVDAYVRYQLDHPDYLLLLLREGYAWSEAASGGVPVQQAETWKRGYELAAQVLGEGVAAGEVVEGPPTRLARLMIVVVQAVLADWVERGMQEPAEAIADAVRTTLLRTLATPVGVARVEGA